MMEPAQVGQVFADWRRKVLPKEAEQGFAPIGMDILSRFSG